MICRGEGASIENGVLRVTCLYQSLAACMVLDTPIQQETHTQSAFIHGATYEQVIGAVDVAADLLGAEAGAVGRRVVEHVRELRARFPHMWPQVEWAASVARGS